MPQKPVEIEAKGVSVADNLVNKKEVPAFIPVELMLITKESLYRTRRAGA